MSPVVPSDHTRIGWWSLGLATALVLWAWTRSHPPLAPALRDPSTAAPWMADALPGIGAKRRDAAAQAIRGRRWSALPGSAQAPAQAGFRAGPDEGGAETTVKSEPEPLSEEAR